MRVPRKTIRSEFDVVALGDWGQLNDEARENKVDDILPHIRKVVDNPRTMLGLFLGDLAYDICDEDDPLKINC